MSEEEDYSHRVYTGSEVNVLYLQDLLNEEGIPSRIQNDLESGARAGFGGGLPMQVQLFVNKPHHSRAMEIAKATFPKEYHPEDYKEEDENGE